MSEAAVRRLTLILLPLLVAGCSKSPSPTAQLASPQAEEKHTPEMKQQPAGVKPAAKRAQAASPAPQPPQRAPPTATSNGARGEPPVLPVLFSTKSHDSGVSLVVISMDGRMAASSDAKGNIVLWELGNPGFSDDSVVSAWRLRLFLGQPSVFRRRPAETTEEPNG
jgi:hypothetical protein